MEEAKRINKRQKERKKKIEREIEGIGQQREKKKQRTEGRVRQNLQSCKTTLPFI